MNKVTSKSEKLNEGKKLKINKLAAGVALISSLTVGTILYSLSGSKEKPDIIIPTPTPKPIETITATPTVTPAPETVTGDTCKIPLISYYVNSGENLTGIIDAFYGELIDEYSAYDEKEYTRVQDKLINITAAINKTDKDKIQADKPLFILSPTDINKDNMYIIFAKNSDYYQDDDYCIQFVANKQDEYDPSIETTDGMTIPDNSTDRLVSTIDYFDISDDGYFTVNAYKYIAGSNFDLYKFVKETYTAPLVNVGLSGGDLQNAYDKIADSIIKLNPSKFTVYNKIEAGDELTVLNPNSLDADTYKFVLYTEPIEYDAQRNRISYYVYPMLQEKGRTY